MPTPRGYTVGTALVAGLLALLFLMYCPLARSDSVYVGTLHGYSRHNAGVTGILGEYRFDNGWTIHAAGWSGHNIIAAGILKRWEFKYLSLGVGGVYINKITKINGTHGNFVLTINTPEISVPGFNRVKCTPGIVHYSNGRKIFGWATDKPNKGWDFVSGVQCGYSF